MEHYDIIIVGAGLAGLTAALDLTLKKHCVLVIEKDPFPRHKVCGEYVSNEVRDYLDHLGVGLDKVRPVSINTLLLSTGKGKSIKTKLPLGGFGISRFAFDNLLYQKAVTSGAKFLFQKVETISFQNNGFKVFTDKNKTYTSNFVIGAFGKRSNIDKLLDRAFVKRKSHWLGIKSHYLYDDFPDDLVALHTFNGGYGGLSKTESGAVNFCYLATYKSFQEHKSIERFNENVISQNPYLHTFLKNAKPIFEEPLSIAQISFDKKAAVENHILMCGDSAGLIHPLCGNGMAMAIHSAKVVSERIHQYYIEGSSDRLKLESAYQREWNRLFGKRIRTGRWLQNLLLTETLSNIALSGITNSPFLLRNLIKMTHGNRI